MIMYQDIGHERQWYMDSFWRLGKVEVIYLVVDMKIFIDTDKVKSFVEMDYGYDWQK